MSSSLSCYTASSIGNIKVSLMSSALVAILFSHQFKWFCTAEGLQHRLASIVIVTIGVHKSVQFGLNLHDSTALARYRCRYS